MGRRTVETDLGLVDVSQFGRTLSHEHIVVLNPDHQQKCGDVALKQGFVHRFM
jgi:hypothetical protein